MPATTAIFTASGRSTSRQLELQTCTVLAAAFDELGFHETGLEQQCGETFRGEGSVVEVALVLLSSVDHLAKVLERDRAGTVLIDHRIDVWDDAAKLTVRRQQGVPVRQELALELSLWKVLEHMCAEDLRHCLSLERHGIERGDDVDA